MAAQGFFMVWNEQGGAPTVKHPYRESARAEAERLALAHPGQRFHVLRAEGSCLHAAVTWDLVDPNDDGEMPF